MAEHIINRDELDFPAQALQHIFLLCHEFFVHVRDADVVQQLVYARVRLLQVLGAHKERAHGDQRDHIVLALVLEVRQRGQMLCNVRSH